MKFSTKEDLEIPIQRVFEMLSDFDGFERMIMRRGAEVIRTDTLPQPGIGMTWTAKAHLRGNQRVIDVTLVEYDTPNLMLLEAQSNAMQSTCQIDFVALSRNRTRLRVELNVKPKTLSARLLMQSAKLARNTLNRRYKTRIANFTEDLQDRYTRGLRS